MALPKSLGRAPPRGRGVVQGQAVLDWCNDARTGMPPGMPEGAMCVQRFDGSLNSAIHITYRISLRSSSMPEPRDPFLKVLIYYKLLLRLLVALRVWVSSGGRSPGARTGDPEGPARRGNGVFQLQEGGMLDPEGSEHFNDPSAGSPTETLLRLLLPLNDQV